MKLARCAMAGGTAWGLVDEQTQTLTPINGEFQTWAPSLTRAINQGKVGSGREQLPLADETVPLASVRLLPPIDPVNRVVVAGANYAKHLAADFGVTDEPPHPVVFLKAYGALIGAHDPIRYPPLTSQLDHEVELVVVIGDAPIDQDDPLASVLGYTAGNDVSARDLQRGVPGIGMDLFSSKSQDETTGLGPWIVTRDEFPSGSPKLRLTLSVDGDVRQDGTTGDMTWDVPFLLKFVEARSRFAAGDVLFTGSPDGVGKGTGRFLEPGQMVEASVEGVGTLSNLVSDRAES